MANIQSRKSPSGKTSYRARVRIKGKPLQTATFTTRAQAKRWATATEARVREQHYFAPKHTLAEAIDKYIVTILPRKSPGHQYTQARQLLWWREQLGTLALSDLRPALIGEYRDILHTELSGGTVNRYLAALSAVMSACVRDWQWLDHWTMPRRMTESRGRVRWLNDDERHRLLEACRASESTHLYTLVVLSLSTGARKGELLGLTWPQVDLARGVITLTDTKNGDRRSLPLTGHGLELMRAQARTNGLVFAGPSGKPLAVGSAWYTAIRRAGLSDFRWHDLRHCCASYLAMGGGSLAEIAELLGHRSLDMTRRYAHLSTGHMQGIAARLDATLFARS